MKRFIINLMSAPLALNLIQLPGRRKINYSEGYQNRNLIELILFKNLQLRSAESPNIFDAQIFRIIAAIGSRIREKTYFNVLDFGGGAGHHQFAASQVFHNVKFNWTIVETEALADLARKSIKDDGLRFISNFSTISEKTHFDLIFSNSAIQYTDDPLDSLRKLFNLNFNYFL